MMTNTMASRNHLFFFNRAKSMCMEPRLTVLYDNSRQPAPQIESGAGAGLWFWPLGMDASDCEIKFGVRRSCNAIISVRGVHCEQAKDCDSWWCQRKRCRMLPAGSTMMAAYHEQALLHPCRPSRKGQTRGPAPIECRDLSLPGSGVSPDLSSLPQEWWGECNSQCGHILPETAGS